MNTTQTFGTIVLTLLIVISAVTVGLAGTATAQSGSVQITDEISSDDSSFSVEISNLQETQTGCLVVTNLETGEQFERNDVSEGEQFVVFADELGGWEGGDTIEATLYNEPFECFTELDSDTRTVQGAPEFEVTVDSTNSPVVEGENLTTTATIENTGEESGTQTIDLFIGDVLEGSREVSLDAGESQQVTLNWQTEEGDAGTYLASVNSENDFDDSSVEVIEGSPATFEVQLDSTTSPVTEGEPLDVTATIENTGNERGTQTVDLRIGDFIQDSVELTLDGGESQEVTFNWDTQMGDAGTYEATVSSEDDSDSGSVEVTETSPASFEVQLNSTNSPVGAGELVEITTTIENTGEETGTQTIELRVGSAVIDERPVTLDAGESQQMTLVWNTTAGDAGTYQPSVLSEDDSASADLLVEEREESNFEVDINLTNSPVFEGETLGVTATVQNTGESTDTQEITLDVGGETRDSRTLTLEGGEAETITLEWSTSVGDAGESVSIVESDDDTATTDVLVQAEGSLDISITQTSSPVVAGEELTVTATIENTGSERISDSLSLRIEGTTVDINDVSLEGSESESRTFTWTTEPGDAGDYVAEIIGEENSDSIDVTVLESGELSVDVTSTNSPVVAGDTLEVEATVENTGTTSATELVALSIDGETVDTTELSIDGSASETILFSWETEPGDSGEHNATVASEEDVDVEIIRVASGLAFTVDITSTNSPVDRGDELIVTATITNAGAVSGTQTVRFTAAGDEHDNRELTLESEESKEITFAWDTDDTEPDEYEVEIASESNSDSSLVTIPEPESDNSLPIPLWVLVLLLLLLLLLLILFLLLTRHDDDDEDKRESDDRPIQ